MKRGLMFGCGGVLALAVVIGVIATLANGAGKPAAASSPAANQAGSSSPASSHAASPATAPKTLLDLSGSGTATTQKFGVGGSDWDLAWSYDCSSTGSQGNFIVSVFDGSAAPTGDEVNQLGTKGASTDYFHDGPGTFYLEVDSECSWHVAVTG